jgi:hypothetical protein
VSDQNPAQKGGDPEIPTLMPKCPSCGKDIPGLNVSTMILPTPEDPRGNMTFLLPCCPHCFCALGAQFVGHTPREAGVATPPQNLWRPS